MTDKEAVVMITAKLECLTRDVSGTDAQCNNHKCSSCSLCYIQGNMGEQKEWLNIAIDAIKERIERDSNNENICS